MTAVPDTCINHPTIEAADECFRCDTLLCSECIHREDDFGHTPNLCATCLAKAVRCDSCCAVVDDDEAIHEWSRRFCAADCLRQWQVDYDAEARGV